MAGSIAPSDVPALMTTKHFILNPSSPVRILIDVLGSVFLTYELFTAPVILAWSIRPGGFLQMMALVSSIFWTMDILANFHTAYFTLGQLEVRRAPIVRHYLRTWFVPDFAILVFDWLGTLSAFAISVDVIGQSGVLRLLKVGRLARMGSLLRVSRTLRTLERVSNYIEGSYFMSVARILSWLVCAVLLNNAVACLWYAITQSNSDTGKHWTDTWSSAADPRPYGDMSPVFVYLTALHWSITQMTPGSIPLQPLNSLERVFNIMCLIFGMVVFTVILSSLSAQLVDIKMTKRHYSEQVDEMEKFLRQSAVPKDVSVTVMRQVRHRLGRKPPLKFGDIRVFEKLPLDTQKEIRRQVFQPTFLKHQFFSLISKADGTMLSNICDHAVRLEVFQAMDQLFLSGMIQQHAFIIIDGVMLYTRTNAHWLPPVSRQEPVGKAKALCWAALWTTQWITVGQAEAAEDCKVAAVLPEALKAILRLHPPLCAFAVEYAALYVKRLAECKEPYPTDLEVPSTSAEDMVVEMTKASRRLIGACALQTLSGHLTWLLRVRSHALAELSAEVASGKSILTETFTGVGPEVVRIVVLGLVDLRDAERRRCVMVGKFDGAGALELCCALPGTKVEDGETPSQALQRYLRESLAPLAERAAFEGLETVVECKYSPTFQVQTKYKRTIQYAVVDDAGPKLGLTPPGGFTDPQTFQGHTLPDETSMFVCTGRGRLRLFAWLDDSTFKALSGPGGDRVLAAWLAPIQRPASGALDGKDRWSRAAALQV